MKNRISDYVALVCIAGIMLVVFLVLVPGTARAEIVQIPVEDCVNYADSYENVVQWRKGGFSAVDGRAYYDSQIPPYESLPLDGQMVVRIVHQQIKEVYAIPEEKFEAMTPEMLAVEALRMCHKNGGKIEIK